MITKTHVKKGDRVIVTTGKDKGKTGDILSVSRKDMKVLVSGVNIVKRHQKASAADAGGIQTKEAPIHISNVMHLDPKDNKPTRIGFKVLGDGKKVRFAKKSGEVIDK
jgi:large subunit ribosomal protein L24